MKQENTAQHLEPMILELVCIVQQANTRPLLELLLHWCVPIVLQEPTTIVQQLPIFLFALLVEQERIRVFLEPTPLGHACCVQLEPTTLRQVLRLWIRVWLVLLANTTLSWEHHRSTNVQIALQASTVRFWEPKVPPLAQNVLQESTIHSWEPTVF